MCPVPIPNTIDYGTAQPVDGNMNAGIVNPSASISAAQISGSSSIAGTRGAIAPATDNGGDHGGLDVDNGADGSKLKPGLLALQHNVYDNGVVGDNSSGNSGTEVVTYIGDWAIYGRGYKFENLPVQNLDRIVYGFAGVCYQAAQDRPDGFPSPAPGAMRRACANSNMPDGGMVIPDTWAAFATNLGGAATGLSGLEDMYELEPAAVGGVFGKLYELREANPHLKLDLSVGGWTLSEGFYFMAKDPAKRKLFVDSVVHFLQRFEFDGIDLDWEYPGSDGAIAGVASDADNENYASLIQELRAGMDWLGAKTGKQYRLSTAIPAGKGRLDKITWSNVHPYLDRLYAMTYDITGAWERNLTHHTPLYTNPNATGTAAGTSVQWTMDYLVAQGVPANKLMLGVANYHRSRAMNTGDISEYTNGMIGDTTYSDDSGVLTLNIAGVGTWEAGVVEGYDLFQNFLDKNIDARNGYSLYTDKVSNADYLVNDSIGSFISIETPRTAALKTQYAKDNGYAGVFFWMAEQDNGYNLNAVQHVLGNGLVTDVADGKPQDQIAVCGVNVSVAECEQLNSSMR
jgi:chitinase